MNTIENLFDINKILLDSFSTVEEMYVKNHIELIFDMDTTIPRELRGNDIVLKRLLVTIFTFISRQTHSTEVLLSLSAPEDFLYEESISFKITNTKIPKEKIAIFVETKLSSDIQLLEGRMVQNEESDIHFEIPFMIGELGFRRHYRLPKKSMLQKRVMLIVESKQLTHCISKMFKYFPYDVEIGLHGYEEDKTKLEQYDLVVIEEKLVTPLCMDVVKKIQMMKTLKFVILTADASKMGTQENIVTTHLLKPVTQESIYELIITAFGDGSLKNNNNTQASKIGAIEAQNRHTEQNEVSTSIDNSSLNHTIEEKKEQPAMTLDISKGLENTQKQGLVYHEELRKFLDIFDKSDLYFRQIVNEKATNKIKVFCADLEKHSKLIGAEGMQKFADIINLIFVYNKLDMLPIYPGRYHIELEKLIGEIKKYLHIR